MRPDPDQQRLFDDLPTPSPEAAVRVPLPETVVVFVGVASGTPEEWREAICGAVSDWIGRSGIPHQIITGDEAPAGGELEVARWLTDTVTHRVDVCMLLAGRSWGISLVASTAGYERIPRYVASPADVTLSATVGPNGMGLIAVGAVASPAELRDAALAYLAGNHEHILARQRRRMNPHATVSERQRLARRYALVADEDRERLAQKHGISKRAFESALMSDRDFSRLPIGLVRAFQDEVLLAPAAPTDSHAEPVPIVAATGPPEPLTPGEYGTYLIALDRAGWDASTAAAVLRKGCQMARSRIALELAGQEARQSLMSAATWLRIEGEL